MSFQTLYRSSPPELKQIIINQWKAKQNPKWHPEGNTLKHIITVTNRAFKNFPDNRDIQLAAYFHDLGKLATYEINPKSGQPTAYGHEKESVDLIDKFSNFVKQQGANPKIVKYIVQNHMKIKPSTWDIMRPSKKDPILNDLNYQDLEKFSTIDKGGLLELQYLSQNKKTNKMTNQILSEEFRRMQKLAGIITESQLNEEENISQEIQALIDKNDFLKGKVTAAPSDIIEGNKFVLLFSEDSSKHIAERHLDGTKPGSLFKSGVNLRDVAKKLLNTPPSEETGGRIKWLGVNGGNVGEMGVAKSSPEEVAKMKEYTMPDGGKEQVKIASGKRKPTNEVSLITAELGTLGNGKKALSIITMFPGGIKVGGEEIPMNRGEFAAKGLYFIVDPSSPLLKESVNKALKRYRRMLNENLEQAVLDFWGTQQDDAAQSDGEYEAEWENEFFIDQYPEYKDKEQEINNIVKKLGILNENDSSENDSRYELHRIVKGILIAARSTAYDAEEREKKLEKELEDLMRKHPEFTEEMVEKVQDDIAKRL